jgi:CRP/FNR family cyclic AMP-dependent transcriptional regulator
LDDAIRRLSLFASLDPDSADALLSAMTDVGLRRGEVLFREGDPADRLYVVTAGKLKFARRSGHGRESLLDVLGPGETFGELSLFDPGPRTATATAILETRLLAVGRAELEPLLARHPLIAVSLLQQLSRRLRRRYENVSDLVFYDIPARVARTLLAMSAQFGAPATDGVRVDHDLTQTEIAGLVGASREAINKVLADFADRGWLRVEGRSVVLVDLERLQRRAR